MKQNITKTQFNSLKSKQRSDLRLWCISKEYDELLSIGQMIEFLDKYGKFVSFDRLSVSDFILNDGLESIKGSEPVDILWGAVKQVLEEEHVKE